MVSGWQRDKWQHEGMDSVAQAWMSAVEKVRGCQIAPGAMWGSGIKQEELFQDTGAYTERRGEGGNHPTHPHTGTGCRIATGTGALLAGLQEGEELSPSIS